MMRTYERLCELHGWWPRHCLCADPDLADADLTLCPNAERDDEFDWLLFLNRCAWVYVCAVAGYIRRQVRHYTEEDLGAAWRLGRRAVRMVENGIDPSGRPVADETIEYATALGVEIRNDAQTIEPRLGDAA